MSPHPSAETIAGLILAGGLSRRMGGGDKTLRDLAGRPVLAHIAARIGPQVRRLALNANGDPARFSAFGLPVLPDVLDGFAGPLAGVLTGLEWLAARHPECAWLVTVPADAPFVPNDLVVRLAAAVTAEGADLACAASGGQVHPVVGLWPVGLRGDLRRALVDEDLRKIDRWTARYRRATVDFAITAVDPFFNVNTPEDLVQAERLSRAL